MVKKREAFRKEGGKEGLTQLYEAKLQSLGKPYLELDIQTDYGRTHVVRMGDADAPPLVVIHGAGTGAHIALEAVVTLADDFCLYGIDIPGHPNKSESTVIPYAENGVGKWGEQVLDGLGLGEVPAIGVSFGGWTLSQILIRDPKRIQTAILVVPMGIVLNRKLTIFRKVLWPYIRYRNSNRDKGVRLFLQAICTDWDEYYLQWNHFLFEYYKFDTRIPPQLSAKDLASVDTPVYVLGADRDVFFPGEALLEKAAEIYPNFQQGKLLKNSQHIPAFGEFAKLSELARGYLQAQTRPV